MADHPAPPPATVRKELGPVDLDSPDAEQGYDYDLLVIGGGSGGVACAKAAVDAGVKKVALCDFVTPSTQGSTWGLGGTCLNVGCVPKKLMHTAALHGEHMYHASSAFGWGEAQEDVYDDMGSIMPKETPPMGQEGWERLVGNIGNHIGAANWGYVMELGGKGITYHNAFAKFVGAHKVELTGNAGADVKTVSARRVVLAVGGRPTVLFNVPGALEHCITSDDLFSRTQNPGKTLFLGAGYVALECAGFVRGIGNESVVMMRSVPLRGFDVDMAGKVVAAMKRRGVRFLEHSVPKKMEKMADGKITVTYEVSVDGTAQEKEEVFDTVVMAVGRKPNFSKMDFPAAGAIELAKSGKIVVDKYDRTTVSHIYAVGDIVEGGLELMPVAARAGRLLAQRLYAQKTVCIDYAGIPTTIFTPLEYGCVGLSEEAATEKFGMVEVYHVHFTPLEWTVPHLGDDECYVKLIVNPFDDERVLGFHILAPNAGEITQGVGVALKCNATKAQFDATMGIHPTVGEEMTQLTITKSSGASAKKGGC